MVESGLLFPLFPLAAQTGSRLERQLSMRIGGFSAFARLGTQTGCSRFFAREGIRQ